MALRYAPKVGEILMCEFPACFVAPEMVKTRPVVVVSPRLIGRDQLVAVVPISNTCPTPVCDHHCEIPASLLPKFMQATGGARWAKCDMIYTLSLSRLSLISDGRGKDGKRKYDNRRLDLAHLQSVRRAAAAALGIDSSLWT